MLLKQNGEKSDFPVLVNLFGTVERVAWGIEQETRNIARTWRNSRLYETTYATRRLERSRQHVPIAQDCDGNETKNSLQCTMSRNSARRG